MLAHMFLPTEPETNVCANKDVLPTGIGQANSLGSGRVLAEPVHCELVNFAVFVQDVLCTGGLVALVHLTRGPSCW